MSTHAAPWTIADQAPLSMGFFQERILEWVAISSSRESSQHRDPVCVSCLAGGFFTTQSPGKPEFFMIVNQKTTKTCNTNMGAHVSKG